MKEKVFIPMSIDQNSTEQSGYFSSPMKTLIAIGSFIPGVIFVFFAYSSSGDSYAIMGLSAVMFLFVYSYILRFLVFEERKLKKMMKSLDENKISNSEYFWGIHEIDLDGVIHYKYNTGLKKAVIVKVSRGSTVGVSSDFHSRFKECNLKFSRSLLSQGFSYTKYTKLEKKQVPEGLLDYSKRLEMIEDEAQRAVMKLNIDTISTFTKDFKSVVSDYYVVYNTDMRLMNTFRSVVRDTMVSSYGNEVYFRGTNILNDDETADFLSEILNIKSVNKKGYYNLEEYTFEDFGEVYRVFDSEGRELYMDLEKEVAEKSKSRIREDRRKGKSLDELEREILEERDNEKEEVIYLDEDTDLSDYNDDEYDIVYVDEDGNEILDYVEKEEEVRNKIIRQDERVNYDLEGLDLFSVDDNWGNVPKKKSPN
jgi:hypothetical protein